MKKLPITPQSQIKNALRQIWLRSRERAFALKRDKYTCTKCGRKQSTAKGKEFKVQVHHKEGIDWQGLCEDIRKRVFQTPDRLETQCKECHEGEHKC